MNVQHQPSALQRPAARRGHGAAARPAYAVQEQVTGLYLVLEPDHARLDTVVNASTWPTANAAVIALGERGLTELRHEIVRRDA